MSKGVASKIKNFPSDSNIEFQTGRISEKENGGGSKFDFVVNIKCDNKDPVKDGKVYEYTLIDFSDREEEKDDVDFKGEKVAVDLEDPDKAMKKKKKNTKKKDKKNKEK